MRKASVVSIFTTMEFKVAQVTAFLGEAKEPVYTGKFSLVRLAKASVILQSIWHVTKLCVAR